MKQNVEQIHISSRGKGGDGRYIGEILADGQIGEGG